MGSSISAEIKALPSVLSCQQPLLIPPATLSWEKSLSKVAPAQCYSSQSLLVSLQKDCPQQQLSSQHQVVPNTTQFPIPGSSKPRSSAANPSAICKAERSKGNFQSQTSSCITAPPTKGSNVNGTLPPTITLGLLLCCEAVGVCCCQHTPCLGSPFAA